MDCSLPAPLSMGFPRQEYWSGLPFPPAGNLPYTGIKPASLMSPTLPDGFFTTSATWDLHTTCTNTASLIAQLVKNPPAEQETLVRLLGREDPLEKGKATHAGILAWRIPWTKSMGSQRVRHD